MAVCTVGNPRLGYEPGVVGWYGVWEAQCFVYDWFGGAMPPSWGCPTRDMILMEGVQVLPNP